MPPKTSTAIASSSQQPKLTAQDVPVMFQRYRTELQNIAQKIGELESELEEHSLVPSLYSLTSKCQFYIELRQLNTFFTEAVYLTPDSVISD